MLAGATGYIGSAVAQELKRRGYEVVALVRDNPARPNATAVATALDGTIHQTIDLSDPTNVREAVRRHRCDAVISCLASRSGVASEAEAIDHHANRYLLEAALDSPIERFVLLSAICVQKPRLAFQFAKLKFEQALMDSGIDYSIVRPTAYFKSLAGQIGRIRQGKAFLIFDSGMETACKPISERDLAHFLVDETESKGESRLLPVGGPGPAITPREQGELLFDSFNRIAKFRSVPSRLFKLVSGALSPFESVSAKAAEKAELARIGHYYATESMLVWDPERESYDAAATPSYGSDTLMDFYQRAAKSGAQGQSLGAQKIF